MRALVIGYGSIGARHARILSELGVDVACVTRNSACPFPTHAEVGPAIEVWRPNRVVVADITSRHGHTLKELSASGYGGSVLVEKPLFGSAAEQPPSAEMSIFVAYNLRFHPLVTRLKQALGDLPLYAAEFHAGQYLPQWRPGRDYRTTYSARSEDGGGVLRDLSHELDLVLWLCGGLTSVAALGGHVSDLEIASDDVYSLLASGRRCPIVALSVNYLDRMPRRAISVNARGLTARLDIIAGRLMLNDEVIADPIEPDLTYRRQMTAFLEGDTTTLCSFADGLTVVRVIAAAEIAARTRCWVAVEEH